MLQLNWLLHKDWQEKIKLHQKRRPKEWKLIETTDLIDTLCKENGPLLATVIIESDAAGANKLMREITITKNDPHMHYHSIPDRLQ